MAKDTENIEVSEQEIEKVAETTSTATPPKVAQVPTVSWRSKEKDKPLFLDLHKIIFWILVGISLLGIVLAIIPFAVKGSETNQPSGGVDYLSANLGDPFINQINRQMVSEYDAIFVWFYNNENIENQHETKFDLTPYYNEIFDIPLPPEIPPPSFAVEDISIFFGIIGDYGNTMLSVRVLGFNSLTLAQSAKEYLESTWGTMLEAVISIQENYIVCSFNL